MASGRFVILCCVILMFSCNVNAMSMPKEVIGIAGALIGSMVFLFCCTVLYRCLREVKLNMSDHRSSQCYEPRAITVVNHTSSSSSSQYDHLAQQTTAANIPPFQSYGISINEHSQTITNQQLNLPQATTRSTIHIAAPPFYTDELSRNNSNDPPPSYSSLFQNK